MRKITVIQLFLLLQITLSIYGQENQDQQSLIQSADGYELRVSINKTIPKYSLLEEVKWTATLTKDGAPANGEIISWSRSKDYYLPSKETGSLIVTNGKVELTRRLNEPGFIQCTFTFKTPELNTLSIFTAVGVEPTKIIPSMSDPVDFDTYWDEQKTLLSAVPLNLRYTPVESGDSNIETFDVQADCLIGNFSAYMARPKNAALKSLPAMVLFHGAGVASSRLSEVIRWAKEGACVIDFNVHGLPNGQPTSFYSELYAGELKSYYMKDMSSRDKLFFRAMLLRVLRAIDIITIQPEWDGKNLISFGRSQGGGQAIAAAGLDSRVNLMCAEIPALCDQTGNLINRVNGWPKLLGNTGVYDVSGLDIVPYFDVVNFARRTMAKSYVTLGYIDLSCPPSSVYAMYNQLRGEKNLLELFYSGHTQTVEGWDFVSNGVKDFLKKTTTHIDNVEKSNISISTIQKNNRLTISSLMPIVSKSIIDIQGRIILNKHDNNNIMDIDCLPSGLYFLIVIDEQGTKCQTKIIKC